MSYFSNKISLITGAVGGIGRRVALKIAARGGQVVLWDIDDAGLTTVAAEIARAGSRVNSYFCDVTDRQVVYGTADRVRNEVGKVDILINNAGVVSGKLFLECADEELERTMAVNTLAHFWTVKGFLPEMIRANSGHIVTISSAGGILGTAGLADYSASKFAAFGFDEALRAELKKQRLNIQTTVVCPFFLKGEMFAGVRTRFSFLLPILDPDYVSERIVKAIALKKRRVIMPPLVHLTWPLRLLPVGVFDWVATFLGVHSAMDDFHGRRSPGNRGQQR